VIVKHLGNGIMLFEDVIDTSDFEAYLERIYAENLDATHGVNAESFTNDAGYQINPEHISRMPIRFNGLSFGSEFTKKITELINDCLYKCLVEYCRSFPIAIECIKWRTSGQIASYSAGQTMGPHSDCALPYDINGNILNSFPLHNTLTSSMSLDDGYEGGAVRFRPWGITVNPKIGSVLIYPSSFMGCHEVEPVTSGVRNSYLQWFCQGETKMQVEKENELNSLAADTQKLPGGKYMDSGQQNHVHVGIIEHT
jgi:hypothetical protein